MIQSLLLASIIHVLKGRTEKLLYFRKIPAKLNKKTPKKQTNKQIKNKNNNNDKKNQTNKSKQNKRFMKTNC